MWLCTLHTSYCLWSTDVITSQKTSHIGWTVCTTVGQHSGLLSTCGQTQIGDVMELGQWPLFPGPYWTPGRKPGHIPTFHFCWVSIIISTVGCPWTHTLKILKSSRQSLNGDNPWPRWQDVFTRTLYRMYICIHKRPHIAQHWDTQMYHNMSYFIGSANTLETRAISW